MIQKLIDAYELEREMYRRCIDTDIEIEKGRAKWDSGLWIRYKVFEDAITVAPRVEAEQTKHGKWEKMDGTDLWCCSVCGNTIYSEDETDRERFHKWCGRCGAKMDECEVVSETGTPPEWGDRSWAFKGGAKMDEECENESC